ncbi:MAG: hypothetical protein KDB69_00895 [Acidimicrobiia bacterium]|nr:hypothetical protein [Acidimicrobiia bacterium]
MGLTFLTGYVLGQHGAQSARIASEASRHPAMTTNELLEVHDRVARLLLVGDALWSILKEDGHSDEELRDRIAAIDLSDGIVDGKRRQPTTECRDCGTKVPAGQGNCQFCGATVDTEPADPLAGI